MEELNWPSCGFRLCASEDSLLFSVSSLFFYSAIFLVSTHEDAGNENDRKQSLSMITLDVIDTKTNAKSLLIIHVHDWCIIDKFS